MLVTAHVLGSMWAASTAPLANLGVEEEGQPMLLPLPSLVNSLESRPLEEDKTVSNEERKLIATVMPTGSLHR